MARGPVRWLLSLAAVMAVAFIVVSFPFAVQQQVRLWVDRNGNVIVTATEEAGDLLSLRQLRDLYTDWWREGAVARDLDQTADAWRRTLRILVPGLLVGLGVGTALGMTAALHRRAREPVLGASILLFAWPDFALILVLQTGVALIGAALGQPLMRTGGSSAFVLPVLSLALFPAALAARTAAEATERVLRYPFMRTAMAKGFSPTRALLRHGLPHVVGQMLADMPSLATITMSNLVMVEVLLSYPGLAYQAWRSVQHWPGNLEMVPAGVALAITWFLLDSAMRGFQARLLPYLRELEG